MPLTSLFAARRIALSNARASHSRHARLSALAPRPRGAHALSSWAASSQPPFLHFHPLLATPRRQFQLFAEVNPPFYFGLSRTMFPLGSIRRNLQWLNQSMRKKFFALLYYSRLTISRVLRSTRFTSFALVFCPTQPSLPACPPYHYDAPLPSPTCPDPAPYPPPHGS